MPKLYIINGYHISIWTNENDEPIHIHIPDKILSQILKRLRMNISDIIEFWKAYHGYEKYYR